MTEKEQIKHEFLLLMGKLGEDNAQFFHCDECPDILDDAFNLAYACNTWRGVTKLELAKNFAAGTLKEFVRYGVLHTLITGRDVIDDLILELDKEKPDAEKT